MSKDEDISSLELFEQSVDNLIGFVQKEKGLQIRRRPILDETQKVCRKWFDELEPVLAHYKVNEEGARRIHEILTELYSLTKRASSKTTYLDLLKQIKSSLTKEVIVPVVTSPGQTIGTGGLSKLMENATEDEKKYFEEALGCASRGFLRASVVLGWCGAVHRIHKVIEKIGFAKFNEASILAEKRKDGRFKRFSKHFNVQSLSELEATVFDNDLLWVIEFMDLIDANQHERLAVCFTMRNNAGHPGEAPITPENLVSFYSDLKTMIFDNPKLKL